VDANPDLSQVVFSTRAVPVLAGASKVEALYELTGANGPTPELRALNVNDEGNAIAPCGALTFLSLGGSETSSNPARYVNEISTDGSKVFFEERSAALPPGGCGSPVEHLLVRLGGQTTIDLAAPQPNDECTTAACLASTLRGATFQGAAADGSKAFFTSPQQLTDAAHQDVADPGQSPGCASPTEGLNGCNIYQYDFNSPSGHNLSALSALQSAGVNARVRQVVGSAEDGSLVYFIARGLLTSQPNPLGQTADAGAENMYGVDTATGGVSFIAIRCTGAEQSAAVHEVAECPGAGVDGTNSSHFDLTPDGRYLLFSTYAQLTPDDANRAADLYRYDAQTGSLLRISIGHDGEDQNGNGGGQDASAVVNTFLFWMQKAASNHSHVISDDGSTIVFTTGRPLQAGAESGVTNVYEWRQGWVSLISNGRGGGEELMTPAVSPTGSDIFFGTEQGLIPTDIDDIGDVYDARVDGGFPNPPLPEPLCESGETCHGPGPRETLQPTLGSEVNRHGPEPVEKPCKKGFVKRHGHCVKVRKHHKHRRHHKRANTNRRAGR
jgi:hypothetical protein